MMSIKLVWKLELEQRQVFLGDIHSSLVLNMFNARI
jgi:hypothetical protein